MIVNPIVIDMDVGTPTQIPMSVESTQTTVGMGFDEAINVVIRSRVQEKEVAPTEEVQSILPDEDYDALSKVTVDAVPSDYIGSSIERRNESDLTVSGGTVQVPSGFYEENESKSIPSGSASTPNTSITANPSISVSSSGLITASVSKSQSVTPNVTPGYVTEGTAGTISVSGSETRQLPSRTSADLTVSGDTVTVLAGWYGNNASKSVASGTEGTPTATKGTVSNHSVSVTPSVTNTEGYISGGTHNGSSVTVSASELVSGTKNISQNGESDVTNYQKVNVSVPIPTPSLQTKTKTYTPTTSQQTESITADAGYDGLDEVNITVNAMPTGTASPPVSIEGLYATASGDSSTQTLTLSQAVNVKPIVSAGYISSGTQRSTNVSLTAGMAVKDATYYHPSTSNQVITSLTYLNGNQTFRAVTTSNLTAENIKNGVTVKIGDSTDDDCVASVTGTYEGGGGTSKNTQVVQGTTRTTSSTMSSIGAEMTVAKTGTYDVYWSGFRSSTSTSYTYGTQLFIDNVAYGSENTTWSNHVQNNHLTNVSLTANQKIRVRGRNSRGSSYYIYAPQLTIVEA